MVDIRVFHLILMICPMRAAFHSITNSKRNANVCCCCFILLFPKKLNKICNFGWIILELSYCLGLCYWGGWWLNKFLTYKPINWGWNFYHNCQYKPARKSYHVMASVAFIIPWTTFVRAHFVTLVRTYYLKLSCFAVFEKSIFMTRVRDTLNFIKVKHADWCT